MVDGDELNRILAQHLQRREQDRQLRIRHSIDPSNPTHLTSNGREMINFAANNYLGLTHHPRVLNAGINALNRFGAGSGASALISGYTEVHADTENTIAAWKSTESAVLLPSGYQANLAAVQTLAAAHPCRFLIDKLAHASLIDAARQSQAEFRVFPHNHLPKLRRLLQDAAPDQMQVVLTESIFSMDGDAADLRGLAQLKRERPFILLLDEAHGSGVYGPGGSGYAAECDLQSIVDISVVTLSKAVGCAGGAVCASRVFCQALINLGRAFIYSTNMPPVLAAMAQAAIGVMRDEPHRQQRLRSLSRHVREQLTSMGYSLPPGDSPILPIILKSDQAALDAARSLREQNLLVLPIRPPTVPPNTSRLRITLSCEHTDQEIDQLVDALRSLRQRLE